MARAIFQKAKAITESRGESLPKSTPVASGGGAFASLQRRKREETLYEEKEFIPAGMVEVKSIKSVDVNKYFDSLFESLALLKETKDYSSAVRSMFSYYVAGKLDGYVIEGLSSEDKNEILGIIREFESTIKGLLK